MWIPGVTSASFRGIGDQVLSHRMAGPFVLFLTERFGMPALQAFMRGASGDDALSVVRSRMETAFGVTLEPAEAGWLAMLERPLDR